ncbi:hypothetical protein O6H91_15G083300 [Diphasiastrum complanatum]|uniref:Uncharacterized protein n=1 Tax=Diphasiastrum complanatum TaxID=34168 RepID=A0ACC2BL76_DIPCM|nr:hypothetical protein O6H91_15G083300 [Diphasiastrum complanatum]
MAFPLPLAPRARKHDQLPTTANQYPRPRRMSGLVSCICAVFIFLLIAAGLAIMVTVILLHPHKPRYRLQDVQITLLNITYGPPPVQSPPDTSSDSDPVDSQLNSDILVTVQSYNRNHHLEIYNTRLVVILRYRKVEIGSYEFAPFYQEPKNIAVVRGVMSIRGVSLRRSVAASLKNDVTRNGAVDLKSELAARVKFRHGSWKSSWHRWFEVNCDLIVSSPTAPNGSHIVFKKC